MRPDAGALEDGRDLVSILTRRGSRVRPVVGEAERVPLGVSILTRRGSRVRPFADAAERQVGVFQSSPGGEAGCDRRGLGLRDVARFVSILTRRGSRVRLDAAYDPPAAA